MSIGERITELRKLRNMSQGQLASMMDVTRQAVSKWETDQASPDTLKLIQLADVLDTEVEYLVTGRRTLGIRPPVVLKTTETVEKIVEKPVVQVVEKVVERVVEKPEVQVVEVPVIRTRRVTQVKYRRNPWELLLAGLIGFVLGVLVNLG